MSWTWRIKLVIDDWYSDERGKQSHRCGAHIGRIEASWAPQQGPRNCQSEPHQVMQLPERRRAEHRESPYCDALVLVHRQTFCALGRGAEDDDLPAPFRHEAGTMLDRRVGGRVGELHVEK